MYNQRIPTIKHWAEDERPRERFLLHKAVQLSDAELIAILIGSGNADESAVSLAQRILHSVGDDLGQLAKLSISDLSRFKGIGLAKAVTIAAAVELCYKRMNVNITSKYKTGDSAENSNMVKTELGQEDTDSYWVFVFSGSGNLQHKQKVGDSSTKFGSEKEILQIALQHESTSIMLVHYSEKIIQEANKEDLAFTLRLIESANMLSMCILDYLILHSEGYYSYRDNGYLTFLGN